MAMSPIASSGRGEKRLRIRARSHALSEINVTPFVDVMLVLLIVFMVTAPLMTVGISVDLPQTNASAINEDTEPLTISVQADGTVYLQETEVAMDMIVPRLRAVTGENPDARIFVRGDKTLAYGKIVEVMGTVSSAGFRKVALLAELPKIEPQSDQPQGEAR